MKFDSIRRFLSNIGETATAFESAAIDVVSAFTPWLAPIIPAAMAHENMIKRLDFDPNTAAAGAAAIEFIGLAAINTAVTFRRYNDDKAYRSASRVRKPSRGKPSLMERIFGRRRRSNNAPFGLALATGVFYITIVLLVNAALDVGHASTVQILSKAGLSLISVVSGIIIALRAAHARRTTQKPRVRQAGSKVHEPEPEVQIRTKADYFSANQSRNGQGHIPAAELVEKHGISKSTAYEWQKEWLNANPRSNPQSGVH